ncbi:MAG: hypothetical protein ACRDGE_00565 [Candidatus Limnocylindria bacterium]
MKPKLVGALLLVVLLLGVGAYALVATGPGAPRGSLVVARDMVEVVAMSDVIVVGTVTAEGGRRNTARDPNDLTREDPNFTSIAQEYVFAVEEVLKGDAGATITVAIARYGTIRDGLRTTDFKYETFIPLTIGARYVLMLRLAPTEPDLHAIAFEPSRFELGEMAVARSAWHDAGEHFPERPTDDFLRELRALIANGAGP